MRRLPHWLVECDEAFEEKAKALHESYRNIKRILSATPDKIVDEDMHPILAYLKGEGNVDKCANDLHALQNNKGHSDFIRQENLKEALQKFQAELEDVRGHIFNDYNAHEFLEDSESSRKYMRETLDGYIQALDDPAFYGESLPIEPPSSIWILFLLKHSTSS